MIEKDFCNQNVVDQAIKEHNIDVIIHFGAETNVRESFDHPEMHYHSNVDGTYSILEAVRKKPDLRLHYISSRIIFPSSQEKIKEDTPLEIMSPYAGTKAASDILGICYRNSFGLKISNSCTANVYGSEKNGALLQIVVENCLAGKPINIHGDGMHLRQWLFEDDHTKAVYMLANDPDNRETYFLGAEEEIPNVEFVNLTLDAVAKIENRPIEEYKKLITFVDDVPGNIRGGMLDTSKVKEKYGWLPETELKDGIERTVAKLIQKLKYKRKAS